MVEPEFLLVVVSLHTYDLSLDLLRWVLILPHEAGLNVKDNLVAVLYMSLDVTLELMRLLSQPHAKTLLEVCLPRC